MFRRIDAGILTHTEIIVSPEDNAEVRRVSLTNQSSRVREIELTSYAEVVLAPPAADAAHPAFSNLFIETEFIAAERRSLLARRRPRSRRTSPSGPSTSSLPRARRVGAVQYETDRGRFLGRGTTLARPRRRDGRPPAVEHGRRGARPHLQPCASACACKPNETARVTFTTAVAHSREEALTLADKYHDTYIFEREARLAWTQAQVEMRHLNIDARRRTSSNASPARVLYADPPCARARTCLR